MLVYPDSRIFLSMLILFYVVAMYCCWILTSFVTWAVRVGFVYLLSGFGGSILSALFIQRSISVGASGALFGLLGAMLSELLANWSIYTNKVAATLLLFVENAHINFFFL